ncbi:MAG: NADH-quinone oxidoreductase subunit C [Cyanobacteria bacterium NC_groundwater_1444_Ag_S-0.65um_54_12]|nr:NADH-quinone oxidoreductase subunit C [Cyanobacteria bacterium NC_groundwater_1444_Ag_S-0.65um_54_12]
MSTELSLTGTLLAKAVKEHELPLGEVRADAAGSPIYEVSPDQLRAVGCQLRDRLGLHYLSCLTTLEWPERWEMVYHLYDLARKGNLILKASIPKEQAVFPTVTDIWPAANWYERECYDMFGVTFEGHPQLCRILLSDDWQSFPLRKDHPMDLEGGY